jgi:3-mercaptopyruvate sulfurtransferase SseA
VLDLNLLGRKDVAALLGGWTGWKEAKLPTASNKPPQTPAKK